MKASTQAWIVMGLLALVGLAWIASSKLLGTPVRLRTAEIEQAAPTGANAAGPIRHILKTPTVAVRGDREGDGTSIYSSVLWPLVVELDLVSASHRPHAAGVAAAGTGADASLKGRITSKKGGPVSGVQVRFLEGANAGRILIATPSGEFGATDLYPGLSIVDVRGDGIDGARREVRLRSRKESLLNVAFGRPAAVFGQVFNHAGEPLLDAVVRFDGTKVYTDKDGGFYLSRVAGGPCLVEVEAAGHADFREIVHVTSGKVMQRERVKFRLQKSCELILMTKDKVGGPGPLQVMLLPVSERSNGKFPARSYPWYRVSPVEVTPGLPTKIDGLPRGAVRVLGFRAGAKVSEKTVNLRSDRARTADLEMISAPTVTGTVIRSGEPVANAVVRMEAPDRVRTTLAMHRQPSYFLETSVHSFPPPAFQEIKTDAMGRFELTAYADLVPVRYLEVWGPANAAWAGRVVRGNDTDLEIELEDVSFGSSVLELDLLGRHMGLPVVVMVNGQPHAELIVPASDPLEIGSLVAGSWKLRAHWQGRTIQEEILVKLEDVEARTLPLYEEQIDGQTAEEWDRAGREWPGRPQ